jgi:hypothetical protein
MEALPGETWKIEFVCKWLDTGLGFRILLGFAHLYINTQNT